MYIKKQIIVAMDVPSYKEAEVLASKLDPELCRVKVGKELFTAAGPVVVKHLRNSGFEVFLDLKFHDIPNTVAGAVRVAADLGVFMINVHALGGKKMMEAAVNAVKDISSENRPLIIGVTILTSHDLESLREIGFDVTDTNLLVTRLAKLAKDSGLDGVVCSGQEAVSIRQDVGRDFILVTPGIRLSDGSLDDQKRVVTPEMAIENGADYLVVGRPIIKADDPLVALQDFNQRIISVQ